METGKTTRLLDRYIQDFFTKGTVNLIDHTDGDNNHLYSLFVDRMRREHNCTWHNPKNIWIGMMEKGKDYYTIYNYRSYVDKFGILMDEENPYKTFVESIEDWIANYKDIPIDKIQLEFEIGDPIYSKLLEQLSNFKSAYVEDKSYNKLGKECRFIGVNNIRVTIINIAPGNSNTHALLREKR